MTDLKYAHKHSSKHHNEIASSALCGCFYCQSVFAARQITEWIDRENTALCPFCQIDSVLGDASGLPVTDKNFLRKMYERWFSPSHQCVGK